MRPTVLLIDADIYAYKYAASAETATDWGDGLWTLHADEGVAWENMKADIDQALIDLKAQELVICLSDSKSWRKEHIYPEYKSNRATTRRPMILSALKFHMVNNYTSVTMNWLEADDVMGLMATDPAIYPGYDKVIVSRDKDMLTVPAVVWQERYKDGVPDLNYVSEEEADYRLRVQTLTGDVTDGYPGCKGIGAVRAARIAEEGWDSVYSAFFKAGHDIGYTLSQARCARILRHGDYDYDKKEPKLWNPPSTLSDVFSAASQT